MRDFIDSDASHGSLREEASIWFAIMRGPEAEARREEFDRWLVKSAFHREAYNRVAETFSLGKALKTMPRFPVEAAPGPSRSSHAQAHSRIKPVLALFLVGAAAGGLGLVWDRALAPAWFKPVQSAADTAARLPVKPITLATRIGEIREIRLTDGSVITLDTDSLVLVSLENDLRRLTLVKGRARFAVVHERRPFLVTAGGGTVRAVGTLFDVALDDGRVDVRLISGAVDVTIKPVAATTAEVLRLRAGDALRFGGTAKAEMLSAISTADAQWPSGLRDFDRTRLADIAEDANRYSEVPLRVPSLDVAELRISGTFRVDDTRKLAANLAEVLGLARLSEGNGIVLLRDCPASSQRNCTPPS